MGPISDEVGVEQGGISSGDYYKIFARSQLNSCQNSELGVKMFDNVVSAIGQSDDTVVVSNSIYNLQLLLQLNLQFCKRSETELTPSKTKLQVLSLPSHADRVYYDQIINPIQINGKYISFSDKAEHVGVLRSVDGNLPHIFDRLSSHRKALFSVLHTGVARNHRGNPVAGLRLEKVYGAPVLLSGLGSLVLKQSEISVIDRHHRNILRSLLRLPGKTPVPAIYFLSGSLPASALIHMRQFTLLGMITRQRGGVLHNHASNIYSSSKRFARSWFTQVENLCLQYNLPHPITYLQMPPDKRVYKSLISARIIDYWEQKLRSDASSMTLNVTSTVLNSHTKYSVQQDPVHIMLVWQHYKLKWFVMFIQVKIDVGFGLWQIHWDIVQPPVVSHLK